MKAMIRFSIILLFLVSGLQAVTAQTPTRLRLKQLELAPDTAYVVYSKDDGTAIWKAFSSVLSAGGGVTGPLTSGRIPRATGTYTLSDGVLRDDGTLLALGGATVSGYSLYDYGTGGWRLPTGTTAQRPGSPTAGALRYNTSNGALEYYGAAAWEIPVKSSTSTGLFTAGSVLFADANGRAAQDNSNFFFNDANNSLGVGTASPNSAARFHAYNNSNTASGIRIEQASAGTTAEAFLVLYNNVGYAAAELFSSAFNNAALRRVFLLTSDTKQTGGMAMATLTTAPINFRTNSTGAITNTRLTIAGAGNIGIAQASPSYILDINSTDAIRFPVGTTAQRPTGAAGVMRYNSSLSGIEFHNGSTWNTITSGSGTNNYITKWTGTNSVGNSALTDNGTTLDYTVSSASDLLFRIWNTGSGTSKVRFVGSDNKAAKHQWTHTSGWTAAIDVSNNTANENNAYMRFAVRGASDTNTEAGMTAATKMTILGSGNVGIGNTAPARTLHVTGEARITDLTTDTPTRIVGADADGDLGAVSEGYGINVTGGALEVDTTQIATQSDLAAISPTTLYTGDGTIATDRTVTIGSDKTLTITSTTPDFPGYSHTKKIGYNATWDLWGDYSLIYTDDYFTNFIQGIIDYDSTVFIRISAGDWGGDNYVDIQMNSAGVLSLTGISGSSSAGLSIGQNTTLGAYGSRLQGAGGVEFDADTGGKFVFQVNNTTEAVIDATGLGINDTSPEKPLDVGGMGKFRQLSGQDNSVTIGTNANMGTGRSASITGSQSSDVAGRFSFTSGTGLTAGEWVTLTWAVAFDNPPAVVLMPEDANGASITPYLFVQPTTTGCSIQVNVTGAPYEGLTYSFNYIVIQGK